MAGWQHRLKRHEFEQKKNNWGKILKDVTECLAGTPGEEEEETMQNT